MKYTVRREEEQFLTLEAETAQHAYNMALEVDVREWETIVHGYDIYREDEENATDEEWSQ